MLDDILADIVLSEEYDYAIANILQHDGEISALDALMPDNQGGVDLDMLMGLSDSDAVDYLINTK